MWSVQQQAILNTMGYTLYVRPSICSIVAAVEVAPASSDMPESTLFKAVMKAVQGRDISQLGIDINALRSSAQAKRALWPQLRAMLKP